MLILIRGEAKKSDPDRTQTCDLQNRNLTFYSLNYGAKCVAKVRNIYSFAKSFYEKFF